MPSQIPPSISDDQWFKQDIPESSKVNRRKSTRYLRSDIGITIRKVGVFKISFLQHSDIPVKLIDISSRGVGVLIATQLRLSINKKVSLIIRFSDFREFEVGGTIVRKSMGETHIYGIKFDTVNNDLANYLLKTQTKLVFR